MLPPLNLLTDQPDTQLITAFSAATNDSLPQLLDLNNPIVDGQEGGAAVMLVALFVNIYCRLTNL